MAGSVYFLHLLWESLFVCPSWKDVFESGYINGHQNLPSCAYNETGLLAAGIPKHQHRLAVGAFIGASRFVLCCWKRVCISLVNKKIVVYSIQYYD